MGMTPNIEPDKPLTPEEQHRRMRTEQAADFTMGLIKGMLQTGYYSSEHPVARNIAREVREQFRVVSRDTHEITYICIPGEEEPQILVEGLLTEAIEVNKAFRGVIADHFLNKFQEYFERNKLASFTVKSTIEDREFETFIFLWVSWPHRKFDPAHALALMTEDMNQHDVINVTLVGVDDVVGTLRNLPWPVKIALGRMRKDLSRLPMLRNASPEFIAKLKTMVISDVVRPLSRPEMTRDLLLNSDLVAEGLPGIGKTEVEDTILQAMHAKVVYGTLPLLLDAREMILSGRADIESLADRDIETLKVSCDRITRKTVFRLARSDLPEARNILEDSFRMGLIVVDQLPSDIRRHIKAVDLTNKFMEGPEAYLAEFSDCLEPRTYLKYLNVMSVILPELTERKTTTLVSTILTTMDRHHRESPPRIPGRPGFVDETVRAMERAGYLDALIDLTLATPREEREGLELGVALFGASAVPPLMAVLTSHDDPSVRKIAVSILTRIGTPLVGPVVVAELKAHRHQWLGLRFLVALVASMEVRAAIPLVEAYFNHPHPRVREECVATLIKLEGTAAAHKMMGFLNDTDRAVVRRVVSQLAAIQCTSAEFLAAMHDAIRVRNREEVEPEEAVQATFLRALYLYEGVQMPESPDLEAAVALAVKPPKLRMLLPGSMGYRPKTDELLVLGIDALGSIGGKRSLAAVESHLDDEREAVAKAAKAAAERIRTRIGASKA
jgi:HEAT repeat protein